MSGYTPWNKAFFTFLVNANERPTEEEHTCSDVSFHINPQTKNSHTKISRGSLTEFKTTRSGADTCMQPQPRISRWGDPDKCKLLIRPTKIELIIFGLKWGWVWGYLWRSSGQSQKKSICAREAFMVSVRNKLYVPPCIITWSVSNLTILSGPVGGWARRPRQDCANKSENWLWKLIIAGHNQFRSVFPKSLKDTVYLIALHDTQRRPSMVFKAAVLIISATHSKPLFMSASKNT